MQDFIIFYNFLMSLDIWSTPTPIFMGSKSVPKIAVFCKINHVVVKRGVIHEEFLWKLFFRKVWILLNISIYYHFFISHIVFKLSAFEVRLQNRFFSTNSVQKATLRVSGINSNWVCRFSDRNILLQSTLPKNWVQNLSLRKMTLKNGLKKKLGI